MPYKYVTINMDGSITSETRPKAPDWKEIQKFVEGPFQVIPYFSSLEHDGGKLNRGTAYCNEEGFLRGMGYNEVATKAWMKACPKGDPDRMLLNGPVLFVAKEKVHADGG
jgi:hypothetical protein